MCGIAGIVRVQGGPSQIEHVRGMTGMLRHRGPDANGVLDVSSGGRSVCLGHARLSIIDLSEAGRQPMANEDGLVHVTFNGEIYNYLELKRELAEAGHVFASGTDTEVLVHGWEEWGEDLPGKLDGMFSLAVWDARTNRALLARDRLGKKPLYYSHCPAHGLAFASELRCFRHVPWLDHSIDPDAVQLFLLHEFVPEPWTVYKGVRKLPPGHMLLYSGGEPRVRSFWGADFQNSRVDDPESAGRKVVELLRRAVEKRLMSDVPLGVFLSGGLDSASVTALMREVDPGRDILSFSVGFEEESFDESAAALEVARHFNTTHREFTLTQKAALPLLEDLSAKIDEPFSDQSILPTWFLTQRASEHITVALAGDGGDELFSGYSPFSAHKLSWFLRLPGALCRNVLEPLSRLVPSSTSKNLSLGFIARRFLRGMPFDRVIRHHMWIGSFNHLDQPRLLNGALRPRLVGEGLYRHAVDAGAAMDFRDWNDEITYQFSRYFLSYVLFKMDRASMAHSLEVREPFLDHALVEYANRLPGSYKMKGLSKKHILKKAMAGYLPPSVLSRPKKGFSMPIGKWLREDFRPMFEDVLSRENIDRYGVFEAHEVRRIWDEHMSGRADNRKQLLTLFMFQRWMECQRII